MPRPDFIGLGAQKAGTSWIYACLADHPRIHMPIKELHFFSRERNWAHGPDWYTGHFAGCPEGARAGEFSTSYLASAVAAQRIPDLFPEAKLIVSLRNPTDRAISNYLNDIRAGTVSAQMSFEEALAEHPEYVEQGCYSEQLSAYLDRIEKDRLLVLIYEESLADPAGFIACIYRFLGVDDTFRSRHVTSKINEAQVPKSVTVDKTLNRIADRLNRLGLSRLVRTVKNTGIVQMVRNLNAAARGCELDTKKSEAYRFLGDRFNPEVDRVAALLHRDLAQWRR